MKRSVILVGVGGQGAILTAKILINGVMKKGYDVKMSEVHGMSQRGGDVQSHLRLSDKPIASDLIPKGKTDLIISVEPMEALRYADMLDKDGWLITNKATFENIPNYPNADDIYNEIKKIKNNIIIDGDAIAKEHGNAKAANIAILGAAAQFIDMPFEAFEDALKAIFGRKGEDVVNLNIEVLRAGAKAAKDYLK